MVIATGFITVLLRLQTADNVEKKRLRPRERPVYNHSMKLALKQGRELTR